MFTDGKIYIVEIKQYFPNILQIFTWKCEGPRIAKTVLKIISKIVRHMEGPGISYYIYHEFIFDKNTKAISMRKNILFKVYCWGQ